MFFVINYRDYLRILKNKDSEPRHKYLTDSLKDKDDDLTRVVLR